MRTKSIIIIILAIVISISAIIGLKLYVKSKEIPIDVSYEKFEEYEENLKIFAKENDFEFSSHGNCDNESCYKTIMLDSNIGFNMDFDFNNSEGTEDYVISISTNKSKTDLFSVVDYDIVDEVLEIVFNQSYKDRIIQMSEKLSQVDKDGCGKTMYLDRKKDITILYYLYYFYKPNTGIRTDDYRSILEIKR